MVFQHPVQVKVDTSTVEVMDDLEPLTDVSVGSSVCEVGERGVCVVCCVMDSSLCGTQLNLVGGQ